MKMTFYQKEGFSRKKSPKDDSHHKTHRHDDNLLLLPLTDRFHQPNSLILKNFTKVLKRLKRLILYRMNLIVISSLNDKQLNNLPPPQTTYQIANKKN